MVVFVQNTVGPAMEWHTSFHAPLATKVFFSEAEVVNKRFFPNNVFVPIKLHTLFQTNLSFVLQHGLSLLLSEHI